MITAITALGVQLPVPTPEGAELVVGGGQWKASSFSPVLYRQSTDAVAVDQNAYPIPTAIATIVITPGANININGVRAELAGRRIRIINGISTQTITFVNNSGLAAVTDRLACPGGVNLVITAGWADLEYDGSINQWRVR